MSEIERVGIKGSVEQLVRSVPLLVKTLSLLEEPVVFPVELHLAKNKIDTPEQRTLIIGEFRKLAKNFKKRTGSLFPAVKIHIPFVFREKPFNLATYDKDVWENSRELMKVLLKLAFKIEEISQAPVGIVAHGYSLNPFEQDFEGLREINGPKYNVLRIYDALRDFSLEERKRIGIETTGTGPCSAPNDLISLARSLDCFLVQDVAHLLRRFYMDETGKMHEREYNNLERLEAAVKEMLPWTGHWHICQHHGGWVHDDWHLAMPGIIDYPRFIPYILESFQKNNATAILEVNVMNYQIPIEGFASFLLLRQMIKEYQKKKTS